MSENAQFAIALMAFVAGWNWGEWWQQRKTKKRVDGDPGLRLLADMALDIDKRRKVVGRALTISSSQKFKTPSESYTLTLEAEGDPAAFDREALQ